MVAAAGIRRVAAFCHFTLYSVTLVLWLVMCPVLWVPAAFDATQSKGLASVAAGHRPGPHVIANLPSLLRALDREWVLDHLHWQDRIFHMQVWLARLGNGVTTNSFAL